MTEVVSAADPAALDIAAAALRRGVVIAIPTETVYGLAVLPRPAPLARLLAAKRRSADKGIQLLVDSIAQAAAVAVLSPAAEQLALTFWPGGLTLVLDRRPDTDLPLLLGGGRPPLAPGGPPATTATMVIESLAADVSLVVDDGPVRGGVASTVVDCSSSPGTPRILREGAVPAAELFAVPGGASTA